MPRRKDEPEPDRADLDPEPEAAEPEPEAAPEGNPSRMAGRENTGE